MSESTNSLSIRDGAGHSLRSNNTASRSPRPRSDHESSLSLFEVTEPSNEARGEALLGFGINAPLSGRFAVDKLLIFAAAEHEERYLLEYLVPEVKKALVFAFFLLAITCWFAVLTIENEIARTALIGFAIYQSGSVVVMVYLRHASQVNPGNMKRYGAIVQGVVIGAVLCGFVCANALHYGTIASNCSGADAYYYSNQQKAHETPNCQRTLGGDGIGAAGAMVLLRMHRFVSVVQTCAFGVLINATVWLLLPTPEFPLISVLMQNVYNLVGMICICAVRYDHERAQRAQFATKQQLRERLELLRSRRHELLHFCQGLIPDALLKKSSALNTVHSSGGGPVSPIGSSTSTHGTSMASAIDCSDDAVVALVGVHDIARVSSMNLDVEVAAFFSALHEHCATVSNALKLERVMTMGDHVAVVGNLLSPLSSPCQTALLFGLRVLFRFGEAVMPLKCVVHRGSVRGCFVGTRWVRYDVSGEAIVVAKRMLLLGSESQVLATKPLLDGRANEPVDPDVFIDIDVSEPLPEADVSAAGLDAEVQVRTVAVATLDSGAGEAAGRRSNSIAGNSESKSTDTPRSHRSLETSRSQILSGQTVDSSHRVSVSGGPEEDQPREGIAPEALQSLLGASTSHGNASGISRGTKRKHQPQSGPVTPQSNTPLEAAVSMAFTVSSGTSMMNGSEDPRMADDDPQNQNVMEDSFNEQTPANLADSRLNYEMVTEYCFFRRFTNDATEARFSVFRTLQLSDRAGFVWTVYAIFLATILILMLSDFHGPTAPYGAMLLIFAFFAALGVGITPRSLGKDRPASQRVGLLWSCVGLLVPIVAIFGTALSRPSAVGNDVRAMFTLAALSRAYTFPNVKIETVMTPILLVLASLQYAFPGAVMRFIFGYYAVAIWAVFVDIDQEHAQRADFVVYAEMNRLVPKLAEEQRIREGLLKSTLPAVVYEQVVATGSNVVSMSTARIKTLNDTTVVLITAVPHGRLGAGESLPSSLMDGASFDKLENALRPFPRLSIVAVSGDQALIVAPLMVAPHDTQSRELSLAHGCLAVLRLVEGPQPHVTTHSQAPSSTTSTPMGSLTGLIPMGSRTTVLAGGSAVGIDSSRPSVVSSVTPQAPPALSRRGADGPSFSALVEFDATVQYLRLGAFPRFSVFGVATRRLLNLSSSVSVPLGVYATQRATRTVMSMPVASQITAAAMVDRYAVRGVGVIRLNRLTWGFDGTAE